MTYSCSLELTDFTCYVRAAKKPLLGQTSEPVASLEVHVSAVLLTKVTHARAHIH